MRSVLIQGLVNRVTITLAVIAAIIFGWNLYVAANDDGILTGEVVDPRGRPVVGAKIVMTARDVAHDVDVGSAVSDELGRFQFSKHGQYNLLLTAEKGGIGKSRPHHIHLYFRNENFTLEAPLVLERGAASAGGD